MTIMREKEVIALTDSQHRVAMNVMFETGCQMMQPAVNELNERCLVFQMNTERDPIHTVLVFDKNTGALKNEIRLANRTIN